MPNIVDLFSGTGGMALAALSTKKLSNSGRIVWTAEQNSTYVKSICRNFDYFAKNIGSPEQVPSSCDAIDLALQESLNCAQTVKKRFGDIHFLLAGPPCQGFSSANRMTRNHKNPNNQLSIKSLDYVEIFMPKVFILENVPGIRSLKTSTKTGETTIQILQKQLFKLGYSSKVMLLDAADYGVPQFRQRSFLIAIKDHSEQELGDEFIPPPTHGPGQSNPFTTVNDALSDLTPTTNGSCEFSSKYKSKPSSQYQIRMRKHSGKYFADHITTKHSEYVLERYSRIPQGGNWTAIESMMTNYTDPSRTHQNIYYRLKSDLPARTIGNFRKSMMIHPHENRGLSLREAARLQSFPDWITFADPSETVKGGMVKGLNAYQQQIGNAVSYLLTESLVSHVVNILRI